MKKWSTVFALALALSAFGASAWAQDADAPAASPEPAATPAPSWMPAPAESPQVDPPPTQVFVFGPRVGVGGSIESVQAFTDSVGGFYMGPLGTTYYPVYSLFGVNLEYRVLLGKTRDHFAIQTLASLFGLEQGLAIPACALLLGYRHHTGLEFGLGPVFNPGGIGMVGAVGYTFTSGGVNIPLDLAFQLPNANLAPAISLSTGFNFTVNMPENRTTGSGRIVYR